MRQTTQHAAIPTSVFSRAAALLALSLASMLCACSPYALSGRVIEGDASYALLVQPDDPRLKSPGVSGVSLRLTVDPGKLNRDVVDQGVSGPEGEFTMSVDRVGAGMLDMDMGILARKKGFTSSEGFFKLPGSGKAILLIMIAPGSDAAAQQEAEWNADEEVRRFWAD